MVFVFGFGIYLVSALAFIPFDMDLNAIGDDSFPVEYNKYYFTAFATLLAFFILGIGWAINLIASRKVRKSSKDTLQRY